MRPPKKRARIHPGEMLLEELSKPLGLRQTDLAEWIRVSYPRLNEIVHAKRGVTPDTALRLEQVFGTDAQFWLNLQVAWDLCRAKLSPEAREIERVSRHRALAAAK